MLQCIWTRVSEVTVCTSIPACGHSNRPLRRIGLIWRSVSGQLLATYFGQKYTWCGSFFLEDGNEINNRFEENIAILIKKMPSDRALLQSDFVDEDIDRFPGPAAYWISHPTNRFFPMNHVLSTVGSWTLCKTP